MKSPYLSALTLTLLFGVSCKNHPSSAAAHIDSVKLLAKDSSTAGDDSGSFKYIENCRLNLPDHMIRLVTRYAVVNGEVDRESQHDAAHS